MKSEAEAIEAWTHWMLTWTPYILNYPTPEDWYLTEDYDGFSDVDE